MYFNKTTISTIAFEKNNWYIMTCLLQIQMPIHHLQKISKKRILIIPALIFGSWLCNMWKIRFSFILEFQFLYKYIQPFLKYFFKSLKKNCRRTQIIPCLSYCPAGIMVISMRSTIEWNNFFKKEPNLSFVAAKIQQNCTGTGNYNSKATRQGIICA